MKRDGTYTTEIEETQLREARQSKRLRDTEAENVRLTGIIVALNQRVMNLEQQLSRARARSAAQTTYVPEDTVELEVERRR